MLAPARRRRRCSTRWSASAARCACASGGEERWIAADDAGLYRDALGACRPAGCPRPSWPTCPTRCAGSSPATRAPTARSPPPSCAPATASIRGRAARAGARRRARARRAAAGRHASASGATPRCCAACAAPRWPSCARRSSRPTSARWPRSCRRWQGVDRHPRRRRGHRPPARGARAAAGPGAAGRRLGARRAAAPRRRLLADVAGQAVRRRRARVGRRGRARPQLGPRGAVLPRGRGGARAAAGASSSRRASRPTSAVRERLAAAPCFFTDLLAELPPVAAEEIQEALWDLVWAGEVTNDAWAPLRAPRLTVARRPSDSPRRRRAGAALRLPSRGPACGSPGAGPLVADRVAVRRRAGRPVRRAGARWPSCCSSATASSPASRCSPRASPAASRALRRARGARDARRLPPRLLHRGPRRRAVRAARRGRAAARPAARATRPRRSCSPPPIRRSPTARRCRGRSATTRPRARSASPAPTSSSSAASRCSTSSAAAAASVLVGDDDPRVRRRCRRWPPSSPATARASMSLERVDGEPVVGSPWEERLIELGFRAGPRKLTLSA